MPIRYRRRRVLIISIVSIFVIIYFFNNRSQNSINNEDNLSEQQIKENKKRFVDHVIGESRNTTATLKTSIQSVREEFVNIDGKKLRKIDWHDYESIARENARIGKFYYLVSSISLTCSFCLSIRIRRRRCWC